MNHNATKYTETNNAFVRPNGPWMELSPIASKETDYGTNDNSKCFKNGDQILTPRLAVEKDGPPAKEDEDTFSFKDLNSHKKLSLLLLGLATLSTSTCFSIMGPFFPNEAANKGMSPTVIGMFFSCFAFVVAVSAPVFGITIQRIGQKFLLISGLLLAGIGTILFGLLDKVPSGTIFIVLCFVLRILIALGAAAMDTASLTILAFLFPNHISTVFGFIEMFLSIGYMLGPFFGGALFYAQGFGLPFWVLGCLLVAFGLIAAKILPAYPDQAPQKQNTSKWRLLTSPLVFCSCLSLLFCTYCIGFLESTLAVHMAKLNVTAVVVGFIFAVGAVLYLFSTPLWGWLADVKDVTYPVIIGGNIAASVAFLLIGPSPLLPFLKPGLGLVIVSMIIVGLSASATVIPAYKFMMTEASRLNITAGLELSGLVSGLLNSVLNFGAFCGPIVGSAVMEISGFGWSATVTAGCLLFTALCICVYVLVEWTSSKAHKAHKAHKLCKANGCIPYKKFQEHQTEISEEDGGHLTAPKSLP